MVGDFVEDALSHRGKVAAVLSVLGQNGVATRNQRIDQRHDGATGISDKRTAITVRARGREDTRREATSKGKRTYERVAKLSGPQSCLSPLLFFSSRFSLSSLALSV